MVIKKTASASAEASALAYSPMLRPCPACGRQISIKARMCPSCGHPVKMSEFKAVVICVVLAIFAPKIIELAGGIAVWLSDK